MRVGVIAGHRLSPNIHAVLETLALVMEGSADCDLIVGDPTLPPAIASRYRVAEFRAGKWLGAGFASCLWATWRYCRRARPDVLINASKPETLGLIAVLAGRLCGVPTAVRMTGEVFGLHQVRSGWLGRLKPWLAHGVMAGLAYRLADRVAAVGEALRRDLVARYPGVVNRVVVLPQPLDVERFSPLAGRQRNALRERLGFGPSDCILLYVGRLSYLKGVDRLVEIARRVTAADPRFRLCAVGEGEFEAALRALGPRAVILPGHVPHAAIHEYFQSADLLVFPSRTEGLPNTILEALACGLPIIASPVGDIPSWVSNLATEPEDYVSRILTGGYGVDPLPPRMTWESQRAAYRAFFESVRAR